MVNEDLNHDRERGAAIVTDAHVDLRSDGPSLIFDVADVDLHGETKPKRSSRIVLLEQARAEVARRKDRRALLGSFGILGDPAWDMLLELYISDVSGARLYASVVGAEAGIPQSTALRWIAVLEKDGLVRRRDDVFDKRRQWVGLTPTARKTLDRHFSRSLAVEQASHLGED